MGRHVRFRTDVVLAVVIELGNYDNYSDKTPDTDGPCPERHKRETHGKERHQEGHDYEQHKKCREEEHKAHFRSPFSGRIPRRAFETVHGLLSP